MSPHGFGFGCCNKHQRLFGYIFGNEEDNQRNLDLEHSLLSLVCPNELMSDRKKDWLEEKGMICHQIDDTNYKPQTSSGFFFLNRFILFL